MKNIVIGMLAHVDAGKTTLAEGLLYTGNVIRKLGRVDNKDAFLDTDKLERLRGITIFAKQAVIKTENTYFTLLDTPGHVDFSAEMERTLAVLDYAVLVISAADGVQSHTRTVWKLLDQYHIPTFIFVNKMDMNGADRDMLMENLQKELSGCCIDFDGEADIVNENLAMCDEHCMDEYLKDGNIGKRAAANAIKHRMVFPCVFGSALKLNNVDRLLSLMDEYTVMPESGRDEFGARVYKISRDAQDNRLTYLKVTSGELKVRRLIGDDKAAQLRIYSGTDTRLVTQYIREWCAQYWDLTVHIRERGLAASMGISMPCLNRFLIIGLSLLMTLHRLSCFCRFVSLRRKSLS